MNMLECKASLREGVEGGSTFVCSAALLLAATGIAKLASTTGASRHLEMRDPILGMPFRDLLLIVGLAELFISFFCLFTTLRIDHKALLVAWLATMFVCYRFGLWWMGWHKPCGCLGNLTDALHISPATADHIMKGVLAYLLIGSYWLLWRQWRGARLASGAMNSAEAKGA